MAAIIRLDRSPATATNSSRIGRVASLGVGDIPPKANKVTLFTGIPLLIAVKARTNSVVPTDRKKSKLAAIPRVILCHRG
jgi:hypothetical protein